MGDFFEFCVIRKCDDFFVFEIGEALMVAHCEGFSCDLFHYFGFAFLIEFFECVVVFFSVYKLDIDWNEAFSDKEVVV